MAITPNKAQIEAAGLEYVEPTEIVKDTGPKALNLLAQAVVDIQAKPASIPGDIPIFATLAEAEAWEAANPGKIALTIESTESDTTPPTLGTLTITPGGTKATAVVSSASDDRGSVEYSFKLNSGEWSAWQSEARHTFTGLSLSTDYTATHRVRDRAGNTVEGYSQPFTTLTEDMWGTLWVDSFANNPDGSLVGQALDSPSSIQWQQIRNASGTDMAAPTITGGVAPGTATAGGFNLNGYSNAAMVELPVVPKRVEITVSGLGDAARRAPRIMWGRALDSHNSWSVGAPGVWLSVDPAFTTWQQQELPMTTPDGAAIDINIDGWAPHTWRAEVEAATRLVKFYEDGQLKFEYTPPQEKFLFGKFVGFNAYSVIPSGYVSSWSVRWE